MAGISNRRARAIGWLFVALAIVGWESWVSAAIPIAPFSGLEWAAGERYFPSPLGSWLRPIVSLSAPVAQFPLRWIVRQSIASGGQGWQGAFTERVFTHSEASNFWILTMVSATLWFCVVWAIGHIVMTLRSAAVVRHRGGRG